MRDSDFQAVSQFNHPLTQLTIRIHDSTQASNYAVQSFQTMQLNQSTARMSFKIAFTENDSFF